MGTHERVKPRTDSEIAGNSRRSLWLTKKTTYEGKQGYKLWREQRTDAARRYGSTTAGIT